MDVKSVFNSSVKDVDGVCVAISRPKKRLNQQHLGILYLDTNASVQLLHLAWHCDLRKELPSDKYLWLNVPLDPINKIHLATVCELIYESNKEGISYGLCIEGTGFAKDGTFLPEEQHAGLTCATFVIQVFHSQGFMIIDFNGWKHWKSDKVWQRQILQNLQKFEVPREHVDYQRKKIQEGAARFKPEEVAVAAAMPDPPYGAEEVKSPASRLLNLVIEHTNRLASGS
jgi:hypothetical protein